MLADVPGRQEEARRLLEQACEIYERVGDDYRLASGLVLLAEAHMNAGDLDGVATLVLLARCVSSRTGSPPWRCGRRP